MLDLKFGPFPVLETNRLQLRSLGPQDAGRLFAIRSNDFVIKYLGRPKPEQIGEIEELIEKIRLDYENSVGIAWAITAKDTGLLIGTVGFWRIDRQNHRAEIGYLFHPDFWGQGLASEALLAVVPFGFNQLRFHSVEANVDPLNEASKRLLQRFGFVQEGYFRENYYFDGRFLDSAIFSLLAKEYRGIGR